MGAAVPYMGNHPHKLPPKLPLLGGELWPFPLPSDPSLPGTGTLMHLIDENLNVSVFFCISLFGRVNLLVHICDHLLGPLTRDVHSASPPLSCGPSHPFPLFLNTWSSSFSGCDLEPKLSQDCLVKYLPCRPFYVGPQIWRWLGLHLTFVNCIMGFL